MKSVDINTVRLLLKTLKSCANKINFSDYSVTLRIFIEMIQIFCVIWFVN